MRFLVLPCPPAATEKTTTIYILDAAPFSLKGSPHQR